MSIPSDFDWVSYLINNIDVANRSCTKEYALIHWKTYGHKENRSYERKINFQWEQYIDLNSDLRSQGITTEESALTHFIKWGRREKRMIHPGEYIFESKAILFITHNMGKGSEVYINNIISAMPEYRFIIMRNHKDNLVIINYGNTYIFDMVNQVNNFIQWMKQNSVVAIHINQLVTYPLDITLDFLAKLDVPYIVTLHDWYLLSGDFSTPYTNCHLPRDKITRLLKGAHKIITPSQSVTKIFQLTNPNIDYSTVYHEILEYQDIQYPSTTLNQLTIGIVGYIFSLKGSRIVDAVLQEIKKYNLPIKIYLFGTTDASSPDLTITGEYHSHAELFTRVNNVNPDIFWIPGLYNETYCYVLSLIHQMGKPLVTPDLPIFRERNQQYKGSFTYSPSFTIGEITSWFINFMKETPSLVSKAKLVKSVNPEYYNIYKSLTTNNKEFLAYRFGLMLEGIIDHNELSKYLHTHPQEETRPLDINFKASYHLVYDIHQYLARQTLMLRKIQTPTKFNGKNKTAVLIEPRIHIGLEPIIRNIMYYLSPEWDLHIFCSNNNQKYLQTLLEGWEYHITVMPYNDLNVYTYSKYLMSANFWNQIDAEHILIFQTDSFILNLPEKDYFNEYLRYSYLGAPHQGRFGCIITLTPDGVGLNGGFSLRRKSAMLKCIDKISEMQINEYRIFRGFPPFDFRYNQQTYLQEDVYFCHALEMINAQLPSNEIARKFAVQDIFYDKAQAIHGYYHPYLSESQIKQILNQANYNFSVRN